MPRLIVLNGPPGAGKSTLAQRYIDDVPLALNLDIDRVRGLLGRWREQATDAGLRARAMALSMARIHLSVGHDVVIAQYIGRRTFLDELDRLAAETGADMFEFVLLDSLDETLRRFVARGEAARSAAHVEAQEMVEGEGGAAALTQMYDRLVALMAVRPRARLIPSRDGAVTATYEALLSCLDEPSPSARPGS